MTVMHIDNFKFKVNPKWSDLDTFYPDGYKEQILDGWVGKWVRFYKNGTPVVGVVLYTRGTTLGTTELFTDVGVCRTESVLESR